MPEHKTMSDVIHYSYEKELIYLMLIAVVISIVSNVLLQLISLVGSLFTMDKKCKLIGLDRMDPNYKFRFNLQYTMIFGYLSSVTLKVRVFLF